jgi:hypothetical protein
MTQRPKKVEDIENLMDTAIDQKEHQEIKKHRHGIGKHVESSVKLHLADEVEEPEWDYTAGWDYRHPEN